MTDKPYRPQEDIVTLMNQFNQQVKDSPELPDAETRLLRARLVFEEALEFVKGCGCTVRMTAAGLNGEAGAAVINDIGVVLDPDGTPDFAEYVDGRIDQLVVTYGALNAAGEQGLATLQCLRRCSRARQRPRVSPSGRRQCP